MLKKNKSFFKTLLFLFDILTISAAMIAAYLVRFRLEVPPLINNPHPIGPYLLLIIPITIIWSLVFRIFNLYRPKRISTHFSEILDIAKACTLEIMALVAVAFFFKKFTFSRVVFIYFWIFSIVAISILRTVFREMLRFFRRKGYNLRHIIIVGDGILARGLIKRIANHHELGLNVIGVLGSSPERVGIRVGGKKIIGTYDDIKKLLNEYDVDQIFIAIPFAEIVSLENIVKNIGNHYVTIKIVPDIHHFFPFCGNVEEFDGLPIMNLQDTPLYGWNIIFKRSLDIIFVSFAILIISPFMAFIALTIKLTSPGPVLYKQRRTGLDGKAFNIFKFRTMHMGAEKETGPVWTKENDSRRTRLGALLRRTSIDELPQFFNVLKGDMSIVGPRPERPEFIETFKEDIPRYMLRLKMKAGITGWAQVNGWRGNTDLKKRLEHDLYYIEHWSPWFDIKIMLTTVWKGFFHKHAY